MVAEGTHMTRIEALKELEDKVEKGEWPVCAWSHLRTVFPSSWNDVEFQARNAYHGSLDAAKALHDSVLPGWRVTCIKSGWEVGIQSLSDSSQTSASYMSTPARAWLLSIIRALIEGEEGQ